MTTVLRFYKRPGSSLLLLAGLMCLCGAPLVAAGSEQSCSDIACYVSGAQSQAPKAQPPRQQQPPPSLTQDKPSQGQPQAETRITPEEAQELFRSVDELLKFASNDTGLPIRQPVKRSLADREQVRKFVLTHLDEDKDTQRLQRSEASMKKFGLLPQEFDLRKFLVDLLEDQVAGYYDAKTKTVYLLDWVSAEAQRPVLAHELTHALQDQNFGLEQWMKVRPDDAPGNPDHLDAGPDEEQAARQAVSEGQGMAVMMDYVMEPSGRTLADTPGMGELLKQNTLDRANDSPVFATAPMYLREMVIFPYTYGLTFLTDLLAHGGKDRAFAGAFKNPPRDTREIMEPDSYLGGTHVPPLRLPKLSDVLKKNYVGYDAGSVGEFDIYILLKQFSGQDLAEKLSTSWRGGLYYLGRKKDAKPPKDAPVPLSDLSLLYVSNWATPEDAGYFAKVYGLWLPKKYKSVQPVPEHKGSEWTTEQGPVRIEVAGTRVLVMEGFEAATAAAIREKVLAGPAANAGVPSTQHGLASPVWATLGLFY